MLVTEQNHQYRAFGLKLESNILMHELPVLNERTTSVDLKVTISFVRDLSLKSNEYEFLKDGHILTFHVPKVATFYMDAGKKIHVECLHSADIPLVKLYILGTCMGIILLQRKILPLHGSLIEINGKAYAFVGNSGVGKSTLASSFINSGYKMVSDDLIAVTMIDGQPWVTPSYPQQKLWQESLEILGMEQNNYQSIFGREEKFCIPVESNYCTEPLPLAGIFEILKNDSSTIEIQSLFNLNRFHMLFNHTYRNFLLPKFDLMDWHFTLSTQILSKIMTYKVSRPVKGVSVNELKKCLLNTIRSEE
ncbi:aldolase [Robertmurraya sp. GLU-23]